MVKRFNLTQIELSKAAPKDREYLMSDGSGLYLRVRPAGEKDWLFKYVLGKKRCKLGLGRYPDVSLKTARVESERARELVAQCIDPKLDRARRVTEEAALAEAQKISDSRLTVDQFFDKWFEAEAKGRSDGGAEVCRTFKKDVYPAIGCKYLEDVRRADIVEILNKVKARGAGVLARNLLGDIRQMFKYAIICELIQADPTFGLKREKWGKKIERDRYLTEDEITLLSRKLPEAGMSQSSEALIWLLLATTCRVGEICSTKWSDVDFAKSQLHIPAGQTKTKTKHTVHLSNFAKKQLLIMKAEEPESPFILPGRRRHPEAEWFGVCPKSLSKQLRDRQLGRDAKPMSNRSLQVDALVMPGGKWTAHDLRRTSATLMGQLDVAPHIIEKCLNHADPNKMQRIYQLHSTYEAQKAAWELIGSRLEELVAPSK